MPGITDFAWNYLCHSYPKCRSLALSIFHSDVILALRSYVLLKRLVQLFKTLEELFHCPVKTVSGKTNNCDLSTAVSELKVEVKLSKPNQDYSIKL